MVQILYDLLYCMPVSALAVLFGAGSLKLFPLSWEPFVFVFLICAFLAVFAAVGRKYRIILAVVVLVEALVLFLVLGGGAGQSEFFADYGKLLYAVPVCLLIFLIEKLACRYVYAKIAVPVLIIGMLIFMLVAKQKLMRAVLPVAMFLVLENAAEAVQLIRLKQKKIGRESYGYLVFLSPFLMMLPVFLAFYKAPDKAYDWNFAKRIYADCVTAVDRIHLSLFQGTSGSYEEAEVGFNEEAFLSGKVTENPRTVMEIHTSGPEQIYLKGKVFDTFDGRKWDTLDTASLNDSMLDYVETVASVKRYAPGLETDFIHTATVQIGYRYFNSTHVFHMLKSNVSARDLSGIDFSYKGANLIARRHISYRNDYSFRYLAVNRSNPELGELLADPGPLSEDEWRAALSSLSLYTAEGLTYQDYCAYREHIREVYCQPVTLSERTAEYLDMLLEGAESDYDKLLRIVSWLKAMKYTESPGSMPEDKDTPEEFLDYLLFENPRGYCTYFATACVLLSRASGIPARLVQGYRAETDRKGNAFILSDMAHSWTEVYLDGFGWLNFEATPGYAISSSWKTEAQEQSEKDALISDLNPDFMDLWEEEQTESLPLPVLPEEEEETGLAPGVKTALLAVLSLAGAVLMVFLLAVLISEGRYLRAKKEERLRILFARNMTLLSGLSLPLKPAETLLEYEKRVKGWLQDEKTKRLLKGSAAEHTSMEAILFIRLYEKFLYQDSKVTSMTLRDSEASNRKLKTILKRIRGFRYLPVYFRSLISPAVYEK